MRWCETENINNLNEIDGRDLHTYKVWRVADGDLTKASEKTQIDTLRVFIRWCESINAVTDDLHTSIRSPTLSDDDARDEYVTSDEADAILHRLNKYDYASTKHTYAVLLWHCGLRVGACRSLDLRDVKTDSDALQTHHRPDTDTPLKNQSKGERYVALSDDAATVIQDYIADRRADVTDDYDRQPLLTTRYGRPHIETLRKWSYGLTRPCTYGECPHERDPDECDAARDQTVAYECPSTLSPHPWRRGAITHWLSQDVPAQAVADRFNVSPDVIAVHYDERTERDKMEQRRKYLDNI